MLTLKINFKSLIYIETSNIKEKYKWLKENNYTIITKIDFWKNSNGMMFFRCEDPDENIVEVFEKKNAT
jgi:hypothetical protein